MDQSPEFNEAVHEAEICAASLDPAEETFHRVVQDIETLHKIRREDSRARFVVSPDAVLSVAGSILSMVLVLQHENLHVIATKAFGLIPRIR